MKKLLRELKIVPYLAFHPFKGFWELKHEGGSLPAAVILLVLLVLSSVAKGFYSGYLFNQNNGARFDAVKSVLVTVFLFVLWCVANWCLTCLFDGEGNLRDIIKATAYALSPLILFQILAIPASHIFILREAAFYSLIGDAGYFWTGALLLISVLVTHQYRLLKGLLMIVCIILGMCVLAYIALLFFNLIGQMWGFLEVLTRELSDRI